MKNIEQYKIFDFLGNTDLRNLTKKEAKEKFNIFMKYKDTRVDELKKIVEPNLYQKHLIKFSDNEVLTFGDYILLDSPKKMSLDYSLESIQAISDWITEETIAYRSFINIYDDSIHLFGIPSLWKSIAVDVTIYYCEVLKRNFDSKLYWIFQDEKALDYQYPAITGWKQLEDYRDGILYYFLSEIYLLLYKNEKREDFLIGRLNYHMEDFL